MAKIAKVFTFNHNVEHKKSVIGGLKLLESRTKQS